MQDRILRDFVKDDPLGSFRIEPEHLRQMPSNRLSLTILIGRQPDSFGRLGQLVQLADHLFLVGRDLVMRFEIIADVDAQLLLG